MDHRLLSSRLVGWLADRRLPRRVRPFAWRTFSRLVGADLDEVERPLVEYHSLTDYFVRRLRPGVRPIVASPNELPSPVDGRVQSVERIAHGGQALQAKGQSYSVAELLGERAPADLAGWWSWICYLSPRDYHRIHSPFDGELAHVEWVEGERLSVAPRVLARVPRVFTRNARVVLEIATQHGPVFMVLVGALNVSRIRLEGLSIGATAGLPARTYRRGDEVGRFELGSTVILVTPPSAWEPREGLQPGADLRYGAPIGVLSSTAGQERPA